MSIAVIGYCIDEIKQLAIRLHKYGLKYGCYMEFLPYCNQKELINGIDNFSHTGVVISLKGVDGLNLAKQLRVLYKECQIALLTDDKIIQCNSYRIPVTLCLDNQINEAEIELIYKKMILLNI